MDLHDVRKKGDWLSGCALRLHNTSKAAVTAGVKEKYAHANVLGLIDVEKRNLDNLLAEELKVVRDNQKLHVDFALLNVFSEMKDRWKNC